MQAIMLLASVWLGGVATQTLYVAEPNINLLHMQQLQRNINADAEPCDDFYEYACGNWARNYESTEYVDAPGFMDYQVNQQLLAAIDSHGVERGIYAKLWTYYAACANLTTPALNGFLRLIEDELQIGWPIYRDDWPERSSHKTQFDWLAAIAALRVYGLNGVFLTQNVNTRLTNGSHYLIELHGHQAHLPLQPQDVQEILQNFGMTTAASRNISDEIMALDMLMHQLSVTKAAEAEVADEAVARKTLTRLEMNVTELEQRVPQIAWRRYLQKSLPAELQVENLTLLVHAHSLRYFRRLPGALHSVSNATLSYYVMLKFMYQLNKDLPGTADVSLHCVQLLRGYMPLAINYVYAQHFHEAQENATEVALQAMFNNLRNKFVTLITENQLKLDLSERDYILDELNQLRLQIGFMSAADPPHRVKEFVEKYYTDLNLSSSNFYDNHLQLIGLSTRRQQLKLANVPKPHAQHVFELEPATAGSSSPVKLFSNDILVPYGYLQLPFFHPQLHPLLQHSLLGFMLAHEIMHAFDFFHIAYDQHGNYNEQGMSVAQHFWPYINCTGQSELTVLSENMADVVGLRLAYRTYFEELASNATDYAGIVPGNFTSPQLFFINSVQFLCANMRKISDMNVDAAYLGHDMHDVRVLRNWPNLEQFAAAFKCEDDTKMNPPDKCRLW